MFRRILSETALSLICFTLILNCAAIGGTVDQELARSARLARDAFVHCDRYLAAWQAKIDQQTGLLRQNLNPDNNVWTPENSAADNFPFMVITAKFTREQIARPLFWKAMVGEKRLAIQEFGLPSAYDLEKKEMLRRDTERLIFGASEYAKDGLVPMLEILGPGAWSSRMEELVEGIFEAAPVETPYGRLPAVDAEVNGEMLQILCRLYWMTGNELYLDRARRIGDAYCYEIMPLNYGVPAHFWDFEAGRGDGKLKLRDHGCEIVSGLSLLYAIEREKQSSRSVSYYLPVKRMLDRIQEIGADSSGLLYNEVDARTGEVTREGFSDCWGYDYYAYYTFYLATGEEKYRESVERVLSNINKFKGYAWEPLSGDKESQDGIADAVEGALGLLSHLRVPGAFEWVEAEIERMLKFQRKDGIVEGWHGDGNYARTALMYAFFKTKGLYCSPWREDLELAAGESGEGLQVYLRSEKDWQGKLCFDPPRYWYFLRMSKDFPRINAFPEWFTVWPLEIYLVEEPGGQKVRALGENLIQGYPVELKAGKALRLNIRPEEMY
ncbi:MAG TPA: hypothetical protein VM123_08035 [archaeon]|nr:hypothetical protein [archaeon]